MVNKMEANSNQIDVENADEHDDVPAVTIRLEDSESVFVVHEDGLVMSQKQFKRLSNALASGHLNFLLGSGYSAPLVPTLEAREEWLVAATNKFGSDSPEVMLLQAEYLVSILSAALDVDPGLGQVDFVDSIARILKSRGNTSIPRRANIFTTNYDLLIEKSCERVGIPYNDGFEGRLRPTFSTGAFSRVLCEQSFAHEYLSQVPTISLMKMHGSLSWTKDGDSIRFEARAEVKRQKESILSNNELKAALDDLSIMVESACIENELAKLCDIVIGLSEQARGVLGSFAQAYRSLCIVNPTKRKFEETTLELVYYELMRLFSNEMDRSNSLLVSLGFSFRDEHILEITKRALRNPTMLLVAFCYKPEDLAGLKVKFHGFDNVWFIVGETEEIKIDASAAARFLSGVVRGE